ncbi:MDR family MFS transporter [Micromonospora matsumotoense]|uniref:MDR family MFS transporter n=1 Tax=Micromonospora matsumotoense TaxID=121616 RepID=UPI0033FC678F
MVIAMMICSALGSLDLTIVSTAAPTIVGQLEGVQYLSLLFTIYIIVAGVTTPLYGKLADLYGTRRLYIFAISAFLVGSALSGAAQSMAQLIVFRALQGVGAGGLSVLTMTVVAEIVPLRERGRFMGMFGAVLGVGAIAGPLLGGVLTDQLSWRWIFYINLPLGLLALAAIIWQLKVPPKKSTMPIDYLGFILLAALIADITLLTSRGGVQDPWSSPIILGMATAGVVLVVLFVWRELRAPEPIMPPRLFRIPSITFACLANVMVHTWITVIGAFVPMFIQLAMGINAFNSGLLQLPMVFGLMVVSIVGGNLITKWRRYKWSPVLGSALAVPSLLLFATMTPDTNLWLVITYMVVFGLIVGLCMQPLIVAIQATAPERDMGSATAAGAFSQRIGGSLGFAALAALFSSRLSAELSHRLPADAAARIPSDGSISPGDLQALPVDLRLVVESAFADTIRSVFLWTIPLMILALVFSLMLKDVRIDEGVEIEV